MVPLKVNNNEVLIYETVDLGLGLIGAAAGLIRDCSRGAGLGGRLRPRILFGLGAMGSGGSG